MKNISSDTGASDFETSTVSQTISGSYTGTLEDGDRIRVKLIAPDGTSSAWQDATINRATKTFSAAGMNLSAGANTVQVELVSANGVSDLAGRQHTITLGKGATITLDQTAPTGSVTFFDTPRRLCQRHRGQRYQLHQHSGQAHAERDRESR